MEMSLEQIWTEVLQMPVRNRAVLAKRLLDSLEPDKEQSEENELLWAREAERRYEEIKEGAPTRPASVVMRAARERFNR